MSGREPNTINSDIILSKSKYLTLKCVTFVTFVTFWHRCQYDTALFVTLCCDSRIVRWQQIVSASSLRFAVLDETIPPLCDGIFLFLLSRIFGDPKELCSNGESRIGSRLNCGRAAVLFDLPDECDGFISIHRNPLAKSLLTRGILERPKGIWNSRRLLEQSHRLYLERSSPSKGELERVSLAESWNFFSEPKRAARA